MGEAMRDDLGCPCVWSTPCSNRCTCHRNNMSGGCRRCCRYGSDEQRRAQAERIIREEAELARLRDENARVEGLFKAVCRRLEEVLKHPALAKPDDASK